MRYGNTRMKISAALLGLMLCFCLAMPVSAAEVLPKAGQTIDKSNIDQYKHLFPEEFLEAFTTGWDLVAPLSITIIDPVDNPIPKPFLDASEKNKGRYSLDADGYITGGDYGDIAGFPFPGIKPGDENFVMKFMWNYDYRYQNDDRRHTFINFQKRRGSASNTSVVEGYVINYQGRMYDDPKPLYKTRNGLRTVQLLNVIHPPVQKNFLTMLIRYIDQKRADDTYIYLPSMRRVLRGEAGQRSTPINSSTQAPDDFNAFAGRIPDFTYKLVGEKKMIVLGNAQLGYTEMKDKKFEYVPIETDNWLVRDVYVIDIIPKDPKYPQGRKRIWVDKEHYNAYYGAAWDRAGALWKVWQLSVQVHPINNTDDTFPYVMQVLGMDIQLGYATSLFADWSINGYGLTEADASPSAMRRIAR